MKKLLILFLYCPMAFAQLSKAEIKNFNFNYSAPHGEGVAEAFSYQKFEIKNAQNVLVERIGEDFKINLEGAENQEIVISKAPSIMLDAQTINLSTMNLLFSESVSINLKHADFKSSKDSLEIDKLSLSCNLIKTFTEITDQVISGCVQEMIFRTSSFNSQGREGIENAIMKAIDRTHDEFKGKVKVEDIKVSILNGSLDISADINAGISGTLVGDGTVNYDNTNKQITIKISEFKFGILVVTSKVFDELEKQESANLKVSKPYIYITVN